MKKFNGKVLFLDRSDINTDEIIPAKYLTENTKAALGPYLFEDLKLEGFQPERDLPNTSVIITRENFGCGSSREHAPWALEANGFYLVIAAGFARIFRRNMFNCGMMAVELPADTIDHLFQNFAGSEVHLETDLSRSLFSLTASGHSETVSFSISAFDRALVAAGGWLEYADANY
jgi:3-isopropylmalate/(R)-2-methylmalate dehydratase small subunit